MGIPGHQISRSYVLHSFLWISLSSSLSFWICIFVEICSKSYELLSSVFLLLISDIKRAARQMVMFSATWPLLVHQLAQEFMDPNPIKVHLFVWWLFQQFPVTISWTVNVVWGCCRFRGFSIGFGWSITWSPFGCSAWKIPQIPEVFLTIIQLDIFPCPN